ncbi:MAG: aminotransferase class V-fold PLP-dependent enzyme, partial [Chitinophagales bacterium]|nr:aminotransferase class V-fold PLP-dependent enzyme [Chitinophagales bacterium]
MKKHFLLNSEITYLNHGSFGACPKEIMDNYQFWQNTLENEPVQFFIKNGIEALQKSKEAFASYFTCHADDVVFMPNPSTAFNTVINSLDLKKNDEILSTDLEYGAMIKTWHFHCKKTGAKFIQQPTKLPIASKEEFLENFWKGLTPQTKYVFLSHITSSTALISPVKEIIDKARSLGIKTIIDGAHVPGHITLNLSELNSDFYTGALHKWMLAPKGFSFLYVKKEWQDAIQPLIVSWGYESDMPGKSQYLDYLEFNGTRDFSAYLTFP